MKFLAIFVLALASASGFETPVPFRDIPLDPENEGRVIGGSNAKDGQFPYQVGLSLNGAWCGGSLISKQYILTACHCVHGNKNGGTAYLGSATRNGGTKRAITAIIFHTGYNPQTIANDIAILKISAVTLNSNINVVKLPARASSYSTYAGVTAYFTGWGKTSDGSGLPTLLKYSKGTVMNNADCNKYYGGINGGHICISNSAGKATCNGDSGGPLLYNKQQIGITSFGSAAGCTKAPSAFTRVTYFRTWIYNAVKV